MNTHEHLRRLVEAREMDSIRDHKHEFSVLAGIRPNLPSLEEAADDFDEVVGEYTIPKDVLSKIDGWTFEMPVERLFAKARKGPLSKAEVQKIVKSLKFEIQDMQRGGERDGVKKFTWLLNTMRTLKPMKESQGDLDEALGVPALNKWKVHQKGGTTAYAITLHGQKVIVGETPSPKGSGLYRYSLYIDGHKYGKQDFSSTRDLFQTIQKAVVESADDIEEAARPTFKKAREALLKYLDHEGWDVKTWGPGGALKIPHATHPHQNLKLWFKGQAVYQSGAKDSIKRARSTWVDIRDMTPEEFVQEIEK